MSWSTASSGQAAFVATQKEICLPSDLATGPRLLSLLRPFLQLKHAQSTKRYRSTSHRSRNMEEAVHAWRIREGMRDLHQLDHGPAVTALLRRKFFQSLRSPPGTCSNTMTRYKAVKHAISMAGIARSACARPRRNCGRAPRWAAIRWEKHFRAESTQCVALKSFCADYPLALFEIFLSCLQ